MMDKADRLRDRIFNAMKQAWKTAAMTAVATVALGIAGGCAQDSVQMPLRAKFLKYDYFQSPIYDPAYSIARDSMAPLFNGTAYSNDTNPSLDIAQTDLNGDQQDEIIATPIEGTEEEETATLCNPQTYLCPFYIIEVKGERPQILGIIYAAMVDRGDEIKNGYWTLTAYTLSPAKTPDVVTYAFDRQQGKYMPQQPEKTPSPQKTVIPAAPKNTP